MTMQLLHGEPAAGPWRAVEARELVDDVVKLAGQPQGRPRIIAVDGRGASGKSTLAAQLRLAVARSAVVHTDDLAWLEPFFAWEHLLRDGVLMPLHCGVGVSFQPPAWVKHGREGMIQIPADVELVVIEGVSAQVNASLRTSSMRRSGCSRTSRRPSGGGSLGTWPRA